MMTTDWLMTLYWLRIGWNCWKYKNAKGTTVEQFQHLGFTKCRSHTLDKMLKEYPLSDHQTILYWAHLYIERLFEEWNKEIRIMLEEAGVFEKKGFRYVNGRQTKLLLVGNQENHLGN